jgi:NADH-quinone oxidoreductase subunit A
LGYSGGEQGVYDVMVAITGAGWPFLLYAVLVVLVTGALIGVTALLGQRHHEPTTDVRYESGLPPAGPLPRRFSIEFYQIAVFFVIFDLEAVFIFAWAIGLRASGWRGYGEVLVFIVLLLAGLVYLWRLGALDWGTSGRQRRAARGGR